MRIIFNFKCDEDELNSYLISFESIEITNGIAAAFFTRILVCDCEIPFVEVNRGKKSSFFAGIILLKLLFEQRDVLCGTIVGRNGNMFRQRTAGAELCAL